MSTQSPFGGRLARAFPTLPKGETIASFETYAEAQAAVDTLAKAAFPVKELAIVGTGLTSVERITGTLSWGRAAGAGALSGAWFGTFLGLLFFIFAPTGASLGILISAVLIGAGFGMIFSVVSYSVNRRRRDFTSVAQVLATRYAIVTESAHAERARSVLGVGAPEEAPPAAPSASSRPMSYGEATDAARRAASAESAESARPARPRYGEFAPSSEETDAAASAAPDDEAERPASDR
ncbi:general stress protein [Agromyces sp. NPDC058484]|uniref:general stress protein n=1 Tax=Agromyces sp. NPDC058484 TaxID=3346524 RepID=UPI00365678B8